ncbi:MAG TPA: DUF502 domain-containing protein [Burkholderiales bacterium]
MRPLKVPTIRRYLAAGLLIWVPLGVTILIIKFLVDLMDQTLLLLPIALRPETWFGQRIPGLGVVFTVVVVLVSGMIVTNLLGRQLLHLGERLLNRIPLVRTIYTSAKKITETIFSSGGKSFRKVVMVEYPRREMWTLAFVTGDGVAEVEAHTGESMVNVFIPTTPNPTSGFVFMVPRKDVIELSMSTDDGLRLILSAGVVTPEYKKAASPQKNVSRA